MSVVQYGFVCVVTGAQQPVGQATIMELAGEFDSIILESAVR